MAVKAVSRFSNQKRRLHVRKDNALAFIDSIDSVWKGHEFFAYWLIERLRPKTVVDLGFDRGLSTIAFGYKNRGQVFGIDWFDDTNYAAKCFALESAFRNISNALRFHYAKNIHLIIGPFKEIAKNWTRDIDLLHIGWSHTYSVAKEHYDNWSPYLSLGGVVLIHDVLAFPEETGRFFEELPFAKVIIPSGQGLGVASSNKALIEEIKMQKFV